MNITVNGKKEKIDHGTSLLIFLKQKGVDPDTVVVEYNYEVVKKEEWDRIILKENDNLEVLRFVGGG
ncbi:MAG: sulfur carrier protein ThiS [Clostridiales bacterium]|nr:sulfur carrier protein ThiS [Clostridiales bacterium]